MGAERFAAVVVLAIAIVLVWATPSPGSLGWLPDPPSGPDRVRTGPIIRTVPENCGLSPATLERLVAEPRMWQDGSRGVCEWSSGRDGDPRRSLSIEFELFAGRSAQPSSVLPAFGRAPVAAAMTKFEARWNDLPVTAVTGLGDEAVVQFSPSTGAAVVVRVGNAVVTVQYKGTFSPISAETARDGAFAVAEQAVAGLGASVPAHPAEAPAHPADAPAPRPTPERAVPDPCGTVSERTLERLLPSEFELIGNRLSGGRTGVEGARRRTCSWPTEHRHLTITATVVPGTDLFDGTRQATRQYVIRHLDARGEETLSVRDEKRFFAVTGLGDQAFAAHVPGVVPATVVFRDGNLLVEVFYEEEDPREPLGGKLALRGAYAAAQEVARAVAVD